MGPGIFRFLAENFRWVAGGFLLTFFSSSGQTYFIALSAGELRAAFDLSHGEFGGLYMAATLASALSLPFLGRVVDFFPERRVAAAVILALAGACLAMSLVSSVLLLGLVIYLLRLLGQGMMTHIAMTAMGRWFAAQRGRAVSLAAMGHQVGEGIFPILFVSVAGWAGWRYGWGLAAILLLGLALPLILYSFRVGRSPRGVPPAADTAGVPAWTRRQVLHDPVFWILLTGIMAPAFIGTTIFFHQVYLVELRGWPLDLFAQAFMLMAATTLLWTLAAGWLVDRFSAVSLLPFFLLPLGLACFVLVGFEGAGTIFVFMALLGTSYGISSTLFGALWPEIYGTRYLGSVRSVVVSFMVLATALGPGLTGYLIDLGVSYPGQLATMGGYCLAAAAVMAWVSRTLKQRRREAFSLPAQPALAK